MLDVGEWTVIRSVDKDKYIHSIYQCNFMSYLDVNFYLDRLLSKTENLHIADDHHRYNAHLESKLSNCFAIIFDSNDCRTQGYHRILTTEIDYFFAILDILKHEDITLTKIDTLPDTVDTPIIVIKDSNVITCYRMTKEVELVSDYYRYIDRQLFTKLSVHLVMSRSLFQININYLVINMDYKL